MFEDARNAELPDALNNLGAMSTNGSNAQLPDARKNLYIQPFSALDVGFFKDGTTDNSAALAAVFARTDSPSIYFPAGTYMVGCPQSLSAASALSLAGAGPASVLRFITGCTLPATAFEWRNISGMRISDLTIDQNSPSEAAASGPLIMFKAYEGDITSGSATRLRVVNSPSRQYTLMMASTGGHTISNAHFDDNYIRMVSANDNPTQCIATTNNNAGIITNISVDRNICVNAAIQAEANYSSVSGNDVSGFAFGNGIFAIAPKSHHLTITGNRIHDSGAAQRDSSGISTSGIETPDNSIICSNIFYNLAGPGIVNFGKYNLICDNIAYNNGNLSASASPVPNEGDWAGFHTPLLGGAKFGAHTRYVGNRAYDDRGTPKQIYGYFDWGTDAVPGITFGANDFTGYGTGRAYKTGNPVASTDAGYTSTVGNLPPCAAATRNSVAAVSDQSDVPTYRGALTGGGALAVLAYCNGASWEAH
jgi:hypothetical protein